MKAQGRSNKAVDVAALLQAASAAHQRGAVAEAQAQYDRILALAPDHAEALYLASGAAFQLGQHARARDLAQRCLARDPDNAFAAEVLGVAALSLGDAALAVDCLEKAVARRSDAHLKDNLVRACVALARAKFDQARYGEAERLCRRALTLEAQPVAARYLLANSVREQRRFAEAAEVYAPLVEVPGIEPSAFDEYGAVLFELGRIAEADRILHEAIARAPERANPYTNLGRLYFPDPTKAAWALALHDKAIALQPDHPEAHNNRGVALYLLGRFEEAAASHRRAIALRPTLAEAHNNLGNDLIKLGDVTGALAAYRAASVLAPDYAEAHFNEALALLTTGQWAEGFRSYEWRWRTALFGSGRPFPQPRWDGRATEGALLVWGEQGIGDEILYAGMVADLAAAGRPLVVETDARLVPLFARSFPGVRLVPQRTPPDPATLTPEIVAQTPAGSLGQYLRTSVKTFPGTRRSYLKADSDRAARYRSQLLGGRPAGEKLVGLSWISRNAEFGAGKTMPLSALTPVLRMPGMQCVDLQYGDTTAERAGHALTHIDGLDLHDDLDGLAGLIAACDLVVTVSNTTAHVAGALGVPVWVLLPAGTGKLWYWGQAGDTTPWYPSARLFRQAGGGWDRVVADVVAALAT